MRHPITHPVALIALATLALNDQLLKERYANGLTGKLSDVAGLVVLPLLLLTLLEFVYQLAQSETPDRRTTLAPLIAAVGIGFAAIQLIPAASGLYEATLTTIGPGRASNTMDPTDLLALPALAIVWRVALGRVAVTPRRKQQAHGVDRSSTLGMAGARLQRDPVR